MRKLFAVRYGRPFTTRETMIYLDSHVPGFEALDPNEIGRALKVLIRECWEMKPSPRTFRADCGLDEWRDYRLERTRQSNRESKRRERVAKAERKVMYRKHSDIDDRQSSLLMALDDRPRTVSALARDLAGANAWHCPDGKPLKPASLRRLINEAASRLIKTGHAKERRRINKFGRPERLLYRL